MSKVETLVEVEWTKEGTRLFRGEVEATARQLESLARWSPRLLGMTLFVSGTIGLLVAASGDILASPGSAAIVEPAAERPTLGGTVLFFPIVVGTEQGNQPTPTPVVCRVTSVNASDGNWDDRVNVRPSALNCPGGVYTGLNYWSDDGWFTFTGYPSMGVTRLGLACGHSTIYHVAPRDLLGHSGSGQSSDAGSTAACPTETPVSTPAP